VIGCHRLSDERADDVPAIGSNAFDEPSPGHGHRNVDPAAGRRGAAGGGIKRA
jgi:hypothetical protein